MKIFGILLFSLVFAFNAYSQSLIEAVKQGNYEKVQRLATLKNINEPDENMATPLMWAVYASDLHLIKWLIDKGGDIRKKGIIYLNDNSYYGNLIGIAAGEGKLDVLKYLIEDCGIDANDVELNPANGIEEGWTALHWAASKGDTTILKYLLEQEAGINAGHSYGERTPLIIATSEKKHSIMQLLLNKGANVNLAGGVYKMAPIHYAALNNDTIALRLLNNYGVDINKAIENEQWTALHIAANHGNQEVYFELLKYGSDANIKNREGKKAEDLIKERINYFYQELIFESDSLYNIGNYDKLREIVKISEDYVLEHYGLLSTEYVRVLNNKGLYFTKVDSIDNAINTFYKALDILDRLKISVEDEKIHVLYNLAQLYIELGQYTEALELFLDVKEYAKKIYGDKSKEYAVCLSNSASAYQYAGQLKQSLNDYIEVVDITKKLYGELHPDYAKRLNNLALVYKEMGKYDKALPYLIESIDIIREIKGSYSVEYAGYLQNSALVYKVVGRYEAALSNYLEALEIMEQKIGTSNKNYILTQSNLANLYSEMGYPNKAMLLHQLALEKAEKIYGYNHPEYASLLAISVNVYLATGQYEQALKVNLDALEFIEKSLGKEHYKYGEILANLAKIYTLTGQYKHNEDEVLSIYIESLKIIENTKGKENLDYLIGTVNLAEYYFKIEQNNQALTLYLEAEKNIEKIASKNHPFYGTILRGIGKFYFRTEQNEQALIYIFDALRNSEKTLGRNHYENRYNYLSVAAIYLSLEQYGQALQYFEAAYNNSLINIDQNFVFLNSSEKKDYVQEFLRDFTIYQSFLAKYETTEPAIAANAYDVELTLKGIVLNASIELLKAIVSNGDDSLQLQFDEFLMNRRMINMQYNLPIAERRDDLRELEEQTNRMESELGRKADAFARINSVGKIKWSDLKTQINDNEVALEFSSFQYYNGNRWTDSTYYVALVLRKDYDTPKMIKLFEERELLALLPDATQNSSQDFNLAYQGSRGSGVAYFDQSNNTGDQLYDLIWKPLDSLMEGVNTIHYANSGLLHKINLAAIPTPDGDLLLEKYQLNQLSSTRNLVLKEEEKTLSSAVVYGGIHYDMQQEQLANAEASVSTDTLEYDWLGASISYPELRGYAGKYGGFSYLPGSLYEAQQVAHHLGDAMETRLITGDRAVEESLTKLSGNSSPSVIHIATHGFYFPDTITQATDRDLMLMDAMGEDRFWIYDDPLLRSALVMAGANRSWLGEDMPAGVEDGILTAKDVSAMNLSNTELVVLSACQTGLGEVDGSEGVTGLQRGFKMAGVRYIMMSLWPVPDKETAEFMETFYSHWDEGIQEAFHKTQQIMSNRYRNEPYKWAGFVLVE